MGLFGGGSKGVKTITSRQIPPATPMERSLLSEVTSLARTQYYRPSPYFLSVLSRHYEPSSEFVNEMRNPYISLLPYKEKWGEYLNRAAQRGIVDSTITQDAMKELGQALAERAAETRWRTLGLLEEARRTALADELKRAALREDALRLSQDSRFNRLYKLWSNLYSARLGTPTTITTSSGGPSLFGQAAGSALGLGFGYWLGPGGGIGKVGKFLKGIFT